MINNQLHEAFDSLHASRQLLDETEARLANAVAARQKTYPRFRAALVTACAFLLVGGISFLQSWREAVAFISIDVNPSMELSLNRWDRVIEVDAYGSDAEPFLELPLAGKQYRDAVALLLEEEQKQGYIDSDAMVSFAVAGRNSDRQTDILETLESYMGTHHAGVSVACSAYGMEHWNEAHTHALSAGKYQVIQELSALDPSISLEECRDMPMRVLYDMLRDARSDEDDTEEDAENGREQHRYREHEGSSSRPEPEEPKTETSQPDSSTSEPETSEAPAGKEQERHQHREQGAASGGGQSGQGDSSSQGQQGANSGNSGASGGEKAPGGPSTSRPDAGPGPKAPESSKPEEESSADSGSEESSRPGQGNGGSGQGNGSRPEQDGGGSGQGGGGGSGGGYQGGSSGSDSGDSSSEDTGSDSGSENTDSGDSGSDSEGSGGFRGGWN